jgi:hypothetical protein
MITDKLLWKSPILRTQDTARLAHDVWIEYTIDDLDRERAGLQSLGF